MKNQTSKFGFTLVELAIVLTITSLLLGSYFAIYERSTTTNSERITNQRLDVIEQAVLAYYHKTGFLPCPAQTTVTGALVGSTTNCSAAAPAGTVDVGAGSDTVRIGAVPTGSLNLENQYFTDGWGNRFGYAIVKDMGTTIRNFNNYTSATSVITIVDDAGVAYNNGIGAFVIWSHGADGNGATTLNAQTPIACGGNLDSENCDNDATFRDMFSNLTKGSVLYFDDIVRWKTYNQLKQQGDYHGSGSGYAQRIGIWSDERIGVSNQPKAVGWQALGFPDELFNSTTGVTVSGTTITFPEGEYIVKTHVIGCGILSFWAMQYDNNTAFVHGVPSVEHASQLGNTNCRASAANSKLVVGPGGLSMTVWMNSTGAQATYGLGRSINHGIPYSYRFLEVWEITN